MFKKIRFFVISLLLTYYATAQITTDPQLPVASKKVTIIFDSSKDSRLGYFTGDLYAHTGVGIEGKGNWQNIVGGSGSWGKNDLQPKLANKGNGIYEIEIIPDINSFYSVGSNEKVINMSFVFRSSNSSQQTNDLIITVFEEGLVISINQPSGQSVYLQGQPVAISATSSQEAQIKLFAGGSEISQNTGTSISANYTFTENGTFLIIAEATANSETKRDSVQVFVRNEVVYQPKPSAYRKGINYPANNSAALVLWAPKKEFVFVLGDFNDWSLSNDFQMKKDGDYFWLELPNLEAGKEYAFQYFIDGQIKIADPYAEKIIDPWNDKFISAETYPGLIAYPEGKTEGIASVLHPGQEKFAWEIENFQVPEKEKLVIYELLVRDFMDEKSFRSVREKLDYLEDLRINVLELMPVNEFGGNSGWGYNPEFYFAPDKYYGPKNELKKLIDECHKRGIAVVIDMVLNHSYGQSPFVQMYMNNWTIAPDNPWYNMKSNFENPVLIWGYDFNHESLATRELVDSVNAFWMKEYKVDGFRFDFTKGFSNTPYPENSWGSEYDAARISNLKRMTNEIWKRKTDAIVIFEHLAGNSEETELANHGILLWGNVNGTYTQAARGNIASSNLSEVVYSNRGWSQPNLIAFPESHDEERILYIIKQTGMSSGSYNIRNQTTALKRIELNSLFHILIPGPKMIWQFGERGYDQSINRCENGTISTSCRLAPKPPYWQYLDNPDRLALFEVMAKLNDLKQNYPEFSSQSFTSDLVGAIKWYKYTSGQNHVIAVGNFDITEKSASLTFPVTGKWYEFFTRDSIEINTTAQSLPLTPGEYRLYSTRKFDEPNVVTENRKIPVQTGKIRVFPNPAGSEINIMSSENITEIQVYAVTGIQVLNQNSGSVNQLKLNIEEFSPGIYLLKVIHNNQVSTLKFVKE